MVRGGSRPRFYPTHSSPAAQSNPARNSSRGGGSRPNVRLPWFARAVPGTTPYRFGARIARSGVPCCSA
eukprot:8780400-Lingulodinium_polyedra.AAC.1